jgi:hypothetical protein
LETLYSRVSEFPVKLTQSSTLFREISSAKVCGVKIDYLTFLHMFICKLDILHLTPHSFCLHLISTVVLVEESK